MAGFLFFFVSPPHSFFFSLSCLFLLVFYHTHTYQSGYINGCGQVLRCTFFSGENPGL